MLKQIIKKYNITKKTLKKKYRGKINAFVKYSKRNIRGIYKKVIKKIDKIHLKCTDFIIKRIKGLIKSKMIKKMLKKIKGKDSMYEYSPNGWIEDDRIRGWNVKNIVEIQKAKWPQFVDLLEGNGPLGIYHESKELSAYNYKIHNTIMCFAYVLALSARLKNNISILDWGGGIGHYYKFSRTLIPNIGINYVCIDLPLYCKAGQDILPQVEFYDDDQLIESRKFDLVLCSGALQCSKDWGNVLKKLVSFTKDYLYITRLPIIEVSNSFVAMQRPFKYNSYDTEFLTWFFNKKEFVDTLTSYGMELVREFLLSEKPYVKKAPEQGEFKGFLFKRY